ncbi:MAG: Gfo/Idh/MocA family oxidoreductase [Pirellulales bacterium]|nr:Gfo/Idh/MocA family oxidoreductase [Pirellulales bacterium]
MSRRIRWGILGTATIAREAVIPALLREPHNANSQVAAIASRDLEKARRAAAQFGIERAYGSYEELLIDTSIDAVYVPLPNHLHVPYALRALECGKHVLCEKPLACTADEAERLVAAAQCFPHLKVMEAFMYRHHPQWHWAKEVVSSGVFGPLRRVEMSFTFFDDNPASILHHAEWGGGALLDIGCYGVSLARFLFGAEPLSVRGREQIDPRFGVDRLTEGTLEFAAGRANLRAATNEEFSQRMIAHGELGWLELETPFLPPADRPCVGRLRRGDRVEIREFGPCDQYGIQADLFVQAIVEDLSVPTPLADGLANMRVIDAIVRSARNGQSEQP